MYLYKKTMKFKNSAGKVYAIVFITVGSALIMFAGKIAMPAAAQFLGFCLLTAAIYIASAYLLRELTFSIEPNKNSDGEAVREKYDFLIVEKKAKYTMKHCHIGLSDITLVREVTSENKKQVAKERKQMKRFTYDTQFAPKKRIEVVCRVGDEEISMLISYDEELFRQLKAI